MDNLNGKLTNAEKIREFHQAVGAPLPTKPTIPDKGQLQMRQRLIDEEYAEVSEAFTAFLTDMKNGVEPDLTALMHELTDLLYVTYGAIQTCGVDPDSVFAEVHRANLTKAGGPRRADGKILKPPNWQPADVKSVIEQLKE